MTKIELIKKVRKEAERSRRNYLREGYTSCAKVKTMKIFIDHIVAIEVATFMKADLLSHDNKIGIVTDAGIVIWVNDDSYIDAV